jgi:hypothetical protein
VLKCDQYQTKPGPHPTEIAHAGNPAAPEHEHADSTWTINAVPTLAPSITANAGTRSTSPPANAVVMLRDLPLR